VGWRGIPKYMHKRNYDMSLPSDHPYVCGEPFRAWSEKWMNSHSDICEVEGDQVFRFTAGKEVQHLPLCPICWQETDYEIPAPQETAFDEVEFHGEHGYEISEKVLVDEDSKLEAIYLWDSIK